MSSPPTQADLEALAERALAQLGGEGRATAWWDRSARRFAGGLSAAEQVRVELAAGGATVTTTDVGEAGLRGAAAALAKLAGDDPLPLPEPAPGRAHDGYDPTAGTLGPLAALDGPGDWTSAAAKVAIASTRGVRAYEQRSFAGVRIGGVTAAAVRLGDLDAAALAAEAAAPAGEPVDVAPGEPPVVLAPWAVATVLEQLEIPAERLGTRIVAPNINLSDSPRFPGTLPRSYDAHGAPKHPSPLIQDGVAHRVAEAPEHLVLVGGGAAGVAELAAPIDAGLLIVTLDPLDVRVISGGELGPPARELRVAVDPLAVLAGTQALTARQRLVPTGDWRSARTIGATVAPALRARGGIRVLG